MTSNLDRLKELKREDAYNKMKNKLATMVSDEDFNKYFIDAPQKLLKYSQLESINDINELLPEEKDYRIILTENQKNSGHWCCITKDNDIYTWFDSYGEKPDGELKYISTIMNKILGQDKKHLSRILKTIKEPNQLLYNETKYQKLRDGINTCGRWCICFLLLHHMGYDLAEFKNFIKLNSKKFNNMPYDILICEFF
jgi:hypothetical protein